MNRANLLLAAGVLLLIPGCSNLAERHFQPLLTEKVAYLRAHDLKYTATKEPLVKAALEKYSHPTTGQQVSDALHAVTDAIGDRHAFYEDPAITPAEMLTGVHSFGLALEDRYVVGFADPALEKGGAVRRGDRLIKVAGVPADDHARVIATLAGGVGKTFVLTFSRGSGSFTLPLTYRYVKDYAATDVHRVLRHAVYLNVPTENLTQQDARAFIPPIFDKLNALADSDSCGLILDLRMNGGGLASLGMDLAGRLFGEGDQLSFMDPKLGKTYWAFQNENGGGVYVHGAPGDTSPPLNFGTSALNLVDPWIAVLIGPHTASAAEMIAIASKNDDHSVLIGEPTAGMTSMLTSQIFRDGSVLHLATSFFSGMNGSTYTDGLTPDIWAVTHWKDYLSARDLPLKAARQWLASKGCH